MCTRDGRAVTKVNFCRRLAGVKLYMQLLDVLVFNFAGLFTDYKILVSVQLFNLNLKASHFFNSREQSSTGQSVLQNPMLKT